MIFSVLVRVVLQDGPAVLILMNARVIRVRTMEPALIRQIVTLAHVLMDSVGITVK